MVQLIVYDNMTLVSEQSRFDLDSFFPALIVIIPLVPRRTIHIRLLLPPRPIQPTPLIIPNIPIPGLTRKLTSRRAPLPRTTEKDNLLLGEGLGECVFRLECAGVVGWCEVGFEDAQWEGDGGGDGAEGYFVVFSNVWKND